MHASFFRRGLANSGVYFSPNIDIFFHILVLQEYRVLIKSRIQLKPVLGGVRMAALSISSHEQTQYPKPAVFLYCRFSLFLKDPFYLD